jgi:hypothetical protein
MLQRVRLACSVLGLCACAQQRAAPAPLTQPAQHANAAPTDRAPAPTSLELSATYADLVRLAVRPLPQPSDELEAALERTITVNLLSLFGRHGDTPGALTLVAFSALPPTREAVALIATDHGYYVRGTRAGAPLLNRQPLSAALSALAGLQGASLFVAAEAQLALGELLPALTALDARAQPAALAVNLAPNTTLPEPRAAQGDALCPAGLAETDAPAGELSVAELQGGLTGLREHAGACLSQADARGAAGGKLELALRIGASGQVEAACVISDETGDARLRACLLGQARKLSFPAPRPAGSMDVQLPLALRPVAAGAGPLLCAR